MKETTLLQNCGLGSALFPPSEFVNEILGLDADADDDFLTNYYDEVEAAAKDKGIDVFSAFDGSVYYFERV